MSDVKHQVTELLQSMQTACDAQDFEQLRTLDERIRHSLQAIVAKPLGDAEKQEVVTLLQIVDRIYTLLISDSKLARGQIAAELKRMQREHKAASAYLDSSLKG